MKKYISILLVLFMLLPAISFVGCGGDEVKKQEFENVKTELEKLKNLQSESNNAIENLKSEIRQLEIEKQKLIAEKKRLEAEVIDLKIKNYQDEEKHKESQKKQ